MSIKKRQIIKRLSFLEAEHDRIDRMIDKNPGRLDIHELKKKRLAYRDELATLKEEMFNVKPKVVEST